ncbi:DUF4192 family protein [Arthrobacter sp. M4]|uniref:DUF4192 family protein n=1 Tax=Arthrobacter sp. M4 TaxID=218160 RepID=UPI001CDC7A23|nr:DUF4192 family protein [Arthrobacter sp. M4]MCA4132619.1 DUF4192 domain-containing protein [Arthrobacter sp. M4]
MEPLTIKSPADVLAFIGHTLGFWPRESLVCITLNQNQRIGATLRIDLPKTERERLPYAQTVAHYLAKDEHATSILFAVYTATPWNPGQPKPQARTIAALTGVIAERGLTIKDGLLVGNDTFTQYDGGSAELPPIPLTATQTSALNAEYIYRGSAIAPTDRITLPAPTKQAANADGVNEHINAIRKLNADTAISQGRKLWSEMLDATTYPSEEDTIALIANFHYAAIRDRLIADIPGLDEPIDRILFAQTNGTPHWSRIEWAQQLLIHAYTRTSQQHAAPILTAIGYINWWEGRGSKAHQFLQLALEADPNYHLARLSDQMVGSGIVAGWSTDKNKAHPQHGLGMP